MSFPLNVAAPPEWQLILACTRTRLDESHRDRICKILQGPVDWAVVLDIASRHCTDPLLYHHLSAEFSEGVPPSALATLEEVARAKAQWGLLLTCQLVELLDVFERAGLLAVPHKGPTLGSLAYGNLGLRHAGDLDFYLPQERVAQAFDVLRSAGYSSELDPSRPREAFLITHGIQVGQYCFRQPHSALVELHTEKTLRYFPVPLDWHALYSRLQSVSVGGHRIRIFSTEDMLVLLSVHGAKHFWNRLSWICDIAELSKLPGVDWDLSESLAIRMGCRRMWLLGLSLARTILDAQLPPSILNRIQRKHARVSALMQQVERHLFLQDQSDPGAIERLTFRIQSHESLTKGLRQCLKVMTQPTEEDWQANSLPDWATPLHAVLRPWRLLRKYGLGQRS